LDVYGITVVIADAAAAAVKKYPKAAAIYVKRVVAPNLRFVVKKNVKRFTK
jgi:hypothetical protein